MWVIGGVGLRWADGAPAFHAASGDPALGELARPTGRMISAQGTGTSHGTERGVRTVVCTDRTRSPAFLAGEVSESGGCRQVWATKRVFAAVHGLVAHDAHPLHFVRVGVRQVEGAHNGGSSRRELVATP